MNQLLVYEEKITHSILQTIGTFSFTIDTKIWPLIQVVFTITLQKYPFHLSTNDKPYMIAINTLTQQWNVLVVDTKSFILFGTLETFVWMIRSHLPWHNIHRTGFLQVCKVFPNRNSCFIRMSSQYFFFSHLCEVPPSIPLTQYLSFCRHGFSPNTRVCVRDG